VHRHQFVEEMFQNRSTFAQEVPEPNSEQFPTGKIPICLQIYTFSKFRQNSLNTLGNRSGHSARSCRHFFKLLIKGMAELKPQMTHVLSLRTKIFSLLRFMCATGGLVDSDSAICGEKIL